MAVSENPQGQGSMLYSRFWPKTMCSSSYLTGLCHNNTLACQRGLSRLYQCQEPNAKAKRHFLWMKQIHIESLILFMVWTRIFSTEGKVMWSPSNNTKKHANVFLSLVFLMFLVFLSFSQNKSFRIRGMSLCLRCLHTGFSLGNSWEWAEFSFNNEL